MRCLCALERQRRDHLQHQMMIKAKPLPPVELVRELLDYDQETGVLTWRAPRGRSVKPGDVAGCLDVEGYLRVQINKALYKAHRVAWLHATGNDPLDSQIDHIDGNRANNRFANLRKATNAQNQCNRKPRTEGLSGYKGVTWKKDRGRWQARITVDSKVYYLGYFDTPELAHMAYAKAAAELHGEFARAA